MHDNNSIENLSLAQQEYIETIHSLCEKHEHAHTSEIATELHISMPSVVDVLQSLSKANLINYRTRQPVTLTHSGEEVAKTLLARHEVLADFFDDVLGFSRAYSEKTACRIEHIVDDDFKSRISAFNSFLKQDQNALNMIKRFKEYYESI